MTEPYHTNTSGAPRLRQAFKTCAIAGAAALTSLGLAGALEWTGYRVFDDDKGNNPVCTLDPACRTLTEDEVTLARSFFGNTIDYERVKIYNRPWMGIPFQGRYPVPEVKFTPLRDLKDPDTEPKPLMQVKIHKEILNDRARTPNGNIYFRDDCYSADFADSRDSRCFSDDETPLTKRRGLFLHEMTHVYQAQTLSGYAVRALSDAKKHDYDYASLYDYDLDQIKDFSTLLLEQQASIVADFMETVEHYRETPSERRAQSLEKFAAILQPHFPNVKTLLDDLGLSINPAGPAQSATTANAAAKTTAHPGLIPHIPHP